MFRISLDALLVLDTIERLGSFAAAAHALHKVPSTISYTVQKLEQDLGVELFERQGPKVTLTELGKELLKEGRYVLKAAEDLEHRIRRVAFGWETELTIGMDSLFSPAALREEITAFYQVASGTRLKFSQEALSGPWEALMDGRVDLLIGAVGEGPSGGGYNTHLLGRIEFVFAVAPDHPLAHRMHPLNKMDLHLYRAIVVSDSARNYSSRTVGLLFGQDHLAVPDMMTKLEFQLSGLGFGFLPVPLAKEYLSKGLLIEKKVEEPRQPEPVYLAWRTSEQGAALKWWLEQMRHHVQVDQLWKIRSSF